MTKEIAARIHLTCLHGFTGAGKDFDFLEEKLGNQYKFFKPNLPGHHCSSYDQISNFKDLSIEIQKDAEKDFKNYPFKILLGYSMGGRVALNILASNPSLFNAAIFIGANPGIKNKSEKESRYENDLELARNIESKGLNWFLDYWSKVPIIKSQENMPTELKTEIQFRKKLLSTKGLAFSLKYFSAGIMEDLNAELINLKTRCLFITGSKDLKYSLLTKALVEKNPYFRYSEILDSGHAAHLEKPEQFCSIVRDFINECFSLS